MRSAVTRHRTLHLLLPEVAGDLLPAAGIRAAISPTVNALML
jgi:hypothetical protein